jgi:hypothetical protein
MTAAIAGTPDGNAKSKMMPAARPRANARRCWTVALIVLMVVALGVRLSLVQSHFGHVDDLGVAATIIEAEAHPPRAADLIDKAQRKTDAGKGTPRTEALLKLDRSPAAKAALDAISPLFAFVAVPLTWTYPPLPFLVTPWLIGPHQSYGDIKLWGRLPSIFFGMAAAAMMILATRKFDREAAPLLGAIAVTGVAFTRESLIMSIQMHSYAATLFTAGLILFLLVADVAKNQADPRFLLSRALLLIACCYLSYQSIMLIPGYLAMIAWRCWRSSASGLIKAFTPSAVLGGVFVAAIVPAYLFRLKTIQAVGWNAGPHGEFLFQPNGLVQAVTTAPWFLIRNGWLSTQAMASPGAPEGLASAAWTLAFLALAMAGLACLARRLATRQDDGAAAIVIYTGCTFTLLVLFVLAGRLTLSPTRHLLLYLPLGSLLVATGLRELSGLLGKGTPLLAHGLPAIWILLGVAMHLGSLPAFARMRADPVNEASLTAIATRAQPELIVEDGLTPAPMLMPSLRRLYPVATLADLSEDPRASGAHRVLYVSATAPFDEGQCRDLLNALRVSVRGACLKQVEADVLVSRPPTSQIEASSRTESGGNALYVTSIILGSARQPFERNEAAR